MRRVKHPQKYQLFCINWNISSRKVFGVEIFGVSLYPNLSSVIESDIGSFEIRFDRRTNAENLNCLTSLTVMFN